MDKLSYALGMSMGHNFMGSGIKELNVQDFANGVAAVYEGKKPEMTYEQAKQTVQEFFMQLEKEMQEANQKAAKQNREIGEAFLSENAKREGVKTTASGLQYEVLESGNGAQPTANDRVEVHYTGKLIDGTVFDSSYKRNKPAAPHPDTDGILAASVQSGVLTVLCVGGFIAFFFVLMQALCGRISFSWKGSSFTIIGEISLKCIFGEPRTESPKNWTL